MSDFLPSSSACSDFEQYGTGTYQSFETRCGKTGGIESQSFFGYTRTSLNWCINFLDRLQLSESLIINEVTALKCSRSLKQHKKGLEVASRGSSGQWKNSSIWHVCLYSFSHHFKFVCQVISFFFFFFLKLGCSQWHSGRLRAQSSLAVPPTGQVWHPGTNRHTNGYTEVKVRSQSWILKECSWLIVVLEEVQCFLRKLPWRGDQPKSNQTGVTELCDRLRAIKTVVCSFLC